MVGRIQAIAIPYQQHDCNSGKIGTRQYLYGYILELFYHDWRLWSNNFCFSSLVRLS